MLVDGRPRSAGDGKRPRQLGAARAATIALALGACSAHGFDGSIYRGDGFAFRLGPLPAEWERIDAADGALSFRDPASQGTVLIQARCDLEGDDVPLAALTNHLFLQFTERDVAEQRRVPFDGREALHTAMNAKLDGVAHTYDVWVLKKDGCVYDLLYFAPPDHAARGLERFRRVVDGFATVSVDAD